MSIHPTTPDPTLDEIAAIFDEAHQQRLLHTELAAINAAAARVIARDQSLLGDLYDSSAWHSFDPRKIEVVTGDVLSTHGFISDDV